MEQAQVLTFLNNEDRDLLLQFCGYSTTAPLHSFGPAVRPHYLIHFILNGKGIFQKGDKTYHLETGQGFFIEPDELTFYQADAKEPWEYLWVGFNGTMVPELLKQIGLSSSQPVFHCDKGKDLYWLVNDMLVHARSGFASDLRLKEKSAWFRSYLKTLLMHCNLQPVDYLHRKIPLSALYGVMG